MRAVADLRVNRDLFVKSEKDLVEMKRNTCNGTSTITKKVYRFKLSDAKVFDFDLTNYSNKYNALYKQISSKKN